MSEPTISGWPARTGGPLFAIPASSLLRRRAYGLSTRTSETSNTASTGVSPAELEESIWGCCQFSLGHQWNTHYYHHRARFEGIEEVPRKRLILKMVVIASHLSNLHLYYERMPRHATRESPSSQLPNPCKYMSHGLPIIQS